MPIKSLPLVLACSALSWLSGSGESSPVKMGPLSRLTHDGLDKQRPSWASDGRRLLYSPQRPAQPPQRHHL